jgi:phospholipase/carboxylesterase
MLRRMTDLLRAVEAETGRPVRAAVIWLHGLGADGHDFEPIVPYLVTEEIGVRFVFPHAPRRAVTINMGLIMPAWYDIRGLDADSEVDERGIRASAEWVEALVGREKERGLPASRIVLAGFSQGGVIALHVALRHHETLAGALALSTYLPEVATRDDEMSAANATLPVFQAHGTDDPMIAVQRGEQARDRLTGLGHPVDFRTYPMQHEVCPDEIADIAAWLRGRLGAVS